MKKTKTKPVKLESKVGKCYVEISMNDLVLRGYGNDFVEALSEVVNHPDFPYGAKTKVILNYGKGDVNKRRVMQTIMGRRMLNLIALKPSAIEVFASKLEDSIV